MNHFRIHHPYYPIMIKMAERYNVKDTHLAACLSGYLVDTQQITDNDYSMVIDSSTIRRQKKRCRRENRPSKTNLSAIYFDGKKDKTLQSNGFMKVEEHVTILNEPGSEYVGHTIPESGKTEHVTESIINAISPEELKMVKVVGSDGTSTNTGNNNGIITRLERHLGKKLHWNVRNYFFLYIF